jgi:hypothetical protein
MFAIIVCVFFSSAFAAAAEGAVWGTQTFSLSGNSFSFPAFVAVSPADLSGSNYAAFPLSSLQDVSIILSSAPWTVTGPSLLNPLVYYAALVGDSMRTFNRPIVILSGLTGCTVSGNDLTCPATGFHSGLLQVTGDLNGLSITSTSTGAVDAITFGVVPTSPLPTE